MAGGENVISADVICRNKMEEIVRRVKSTGAPRRPVTQEKLTFRPGGLRGEAKQEGAAQTDDSLLEGLRTVEAVAAEPVEEATPAPAEEVTKPQFELLPKDYVESKLNTESSHVFARHSFTILKKETEADRILRTAQNLMLINAGREEGAGASRVSYEYKCSDTRNRAVVSVLPLSDREFFAAYGPTGNDMQDRSIILKWSMECTDSPLLTFVSPELEITCIQWSAPDVMLAGTASGALLMWKVDSSTTKTATRIWPRQKSWQTDSYRIVSIYQLSGYRLVTIDEEHNLRIWALSIDLGVPTVRSCKPNKSTYPCVLDTSIDTDERIICVRQDGGFHFITLQNEETQVESDNQDKSQDRTQVTVTACAFQRKPVLPKLCVLSSVHWAMSLWDMSSCQLKYAFEPEPGVTYTTHVDWSPTVATVFANCTRDGYWNVWNTALPSWQYNPVTTQHNPDAEYTRLAFTTDGKRLIVGTADGAVLVSPI